MSDYFDSELVTTPVGTLDIVATSKGVTSIEYSEARPSPCGFLKSSNSHIQHAREQLEEYFAGIRKYFDFPLVIKGTPFQEKAWLALVSIPFGETRTYEDQAIAIGNRNAVRAVAHANHDNKLAIVVPCHRVIGKDGTLTGYGGGLWRKQWLLEFEQSRAMQVV